jgi:hypothetical protein
MVGGARVKYFRGWKLDRFNKMKRSLDRGYKPKFHSKQAWINLLAVRPTQCEGYINHSTKRNHTIKPHTRCAANVKRGRIGQARELGRNFGGRSSTQLSVAGMVKRDSTSSTGIVLLPEPMPEYLHKQMLGIAIRLQPIGTNAKEINRVHGQCNGPTSIILVENQERKKDLLNRDASIDSTGILAVGEESARIF